MPDEYYDDIAGIAKLVFNTIYDDSRSTANIETYCKKEECWVIVGKKEYALSNDTLNCLVTPAEREIEVERARKDQKFDNGLMDEIGIFNKGSAYWESLIQRGLQQDVISVGEAEILKAAVNYCNGVYMQLSKKQIKDIVAIQAKLNENKID